MIKWPYYKTAVTAMLLMANSAGAQKLFLRQYKAFPDYSSASAIAWHKKTLYVMGDDAPTLLLLNRILKKKKEAGLFNYKEKRVPYKEKADLESAALISDGSKTSLWLFPSFSTPARNKAVALNLDTQTPHPLFYILNLGVSGLPHTNIEGAAVIGNKLLLANRANSQSPAHHLLQYDFKDNSFSAKPARSFTLSLPATKTIIGISGLHYEAKRDVLLLTFSTELTPSATADGAIGDSYLAIIEKASEQLANSKSLKADTLINLTPVLRTGKPMKIESVTVRKVTGNKLQLFLAAYNDDGSSHLFRASLKLRR